MQIQFVNINVDVKRSFYKSLTVFHAFPMHRILKDSELQNQIVSFCGDSSMRLLIGPGLAQDSLRDRSEKAADDSKSCRDTRRSSSASSRSM